MRTVRYLPDVVDVAQLVELRIVTPAVEGSNPFVHPTFPLVCFRSSDLPVPGSALRWLRESGGIGRRTGFRFQRGNQIGRASCRERVWISMGGGVGSKKRDRRVSGR